ncbi:histone-lysine N-methyltransferase SMYD3-like isoform X2 [Panulirus ornatus]|uniref:histone-lysine N-methyltransferase SMYD3-like isoform X2 n=1 Tax=Panulirus ornatus TaxID=150431 RepID=UPI003A8919BC
MREYSGSYRSRAKKVRPVRRGEVVLTSEPFVHIINYEYASRYCDNCLTTFKEALLRPCSVCRVTWYCSRECRDLSWHLHRWECPYLKRRFSSPPQDFVRLMARIIFKLRLLVNRFSLMDKTFLNIGSALYLAASIFDHACKPNCYISFVGKKVQIRALVDMPVFDYSKCRISYVDPVSSVTKRREDLHEKWFFWCDCGTCQDQERAKFENSVKCENWDCQAPVYVPETRRDKRGPLQQGGSTTAGKQSSGQQQENKGQQKEEEEQMATTSKEEQREGQQIEEADDAKDSLGRQQEEEEEEEAARPVCSLCESPVSEGTVRRYQEAVAFTKEKLKAMTEENPTMTYCLEMLEKQDNIFSPMNVWRVRTLDFAFNAAMFNGCWSLTLKYGEENLNGMRYYYGADHPTYSLFLFKFGKAKIYFKEFREGLRLLEEAEPLLKIGVGPNHPIINELHLISLMANEDIEICLERRIAASKKREMELKKKHEMADFRAEIERKLSMLLSPVA